MKVCVFTLGCKVNRYESDVIINKLIERGYEVTENLEKADYYVINTCAVTAEAEKKIPSVRRAREKNKNPDAKKSSFAVARPKNNAKQFEKDGVVYVSGTAKKDLLALLPESGVNVEDIPKSYEESGFAENVRTRAYVKIQDGCNNFCSYCLIPYVRGRSRSRALDKVVEEVRSVPENIKEIVLTGIDISSYGKDIGLSLKDLILALSDVDKRIRLGSFEMNIIDDGLLNALKGLKHFCPHFHLSLQSGSDEVLRTMNRHYKTKDYLERVRLIRKYYPLAGITTDVIVGFPTETDKEFSISKEFVKSVGFSDVHCFPYSPRKGTVAYKKYKPLDSSSLIDGRMKEMLEIKENLKNDFLLKNVGATHEVLFEEYENGYCAGYSENYIRFYDKTAKTRRNQKKITGKAQIFDGLM
ncbi:MAG: tRNA (N(6)-L-threonylcarbamoyladenosine(37)-C(2))-methylthiotransferase MtaB [Clostridium sp.]|nr:MAG: tRNA (N(6)-L-threonylcarbamoyladenosine(37)-C(2))-methylthiotransferase MtaB [Clostridium sp.]